ncbi:Peptidyl-prolyl cis-trans isomerase [Arcticibacter svalbardensis MN12-7]|uniref:peptidylprolyl isomerase n=1 Tax=Arcticibacter svalbardensis MN12-7 TaxID=1150600 RepID=R9GV57_9SPHI|nr:peptidylprolyl isomerase [Arcticibacter svalbardensis]EOR95410.1 Peptidyl-prolyl cis-trans isomerase [Arcticibacter svalbardensis MN12-7]
MKSFIITAIFSFLVLISSAQSRFVRLHTNKGDILLHLYDETPKHRDAFIKSIEEGLYDHAAFNRVIKSFVNQGGELDETILDREKLHPELPLKRIDAEIIPSLYHKKGALGAGRNDNLQKRSYLTQIYLVAGKRQTDKQLDFLEQKKGIKFSAEQREVYKTIGGIPRLDQDYTIFGEIIQGMDVADAINATATNSQDLPINPIIFTPEIVSIKESTRILKKLHLIE